MAREVNARPSPEAIESFTSSPGNRQVFRAHHIVQSPEQPLRAQLPNLAQQLIDQSPTIDTPTTPANHERELTVLSHLQAHSAEDEVRSQLQPLARINVTEQAIGGWSPLTRPLFYANRFMVGTEFPLGRGPENDRTNAPGIIRAEWRMPFTQVNQNGLMFDSDFTGTEKLLTDIQWLQPGESLIYASQDDLQICRWDKSRVLVDKLVAPNPAEEAQAYEVRQIAVSPRGSSILLGDSSHAIRQYNVHQSGVSPGFKHVFPNAPVGGVSWNPYDQNQVNYTLDDGIFGIADLRQNSLNVLFSRKFGWTSRNDRLFAHCALSEYTFVLGYEGGRGHVIDVRSGSANMITRTWVDPSLRDIGELIRPNQTGFHSNLTIACGIGGFTVWDFNTGRHLEEVTPLESIPVPVPKDCYKTSGTFVPGYDSLFAMTDSCGYMSFYDLSKYERR